MKIFVCLPVVVGNGSKYVATNLAHYTKIKYPDKKVALVDFDFENPYLAEKLSQADTVHSIDNIIDKIDGNFLTVELFNENMITLKDGVSLLKGTKINNSSKIIQQTHIEKIIELLKAEYDYVFIAVSNNISSGTVYSLLNANEIIVVAKNNYSNLRAYKKTLRVVNSYKNNDSNLRLIINQYCDISDVSFGNTISEVEIVPYDASSFDNSDLDKKNITTKLFKSKSGTDEVFQNILLKIIK